MDAELLAWLAGPDGREAIRRAASSAPPGPLTSGQRAAVLTQVDLAKQAGLIPGHWLLTRDGLEQATRPEVAARHAEHLARVCTAAVDLGAGLGFDAAAMVAAGLTVTAVEQDQVRLGCLRANVPQARVIAGDLTDPAIRDQALADPHAVVFVDPGRRAQSRQADGRRAHPERDPERWSPPWSFVLGIADRRKVVVKAAAGIPRSLIPEGWQAEWVSVNGVLLEALLTNTGALGGTGQAAVRRSGHWHVLVRSSTDKINSDEFTSDGLTIASTVGALVHEVDPAVLAAKATATLADHLGAGSLTEDGRWLTSAVRPAPEHAAFVRSYSVIEELPAQLPALRKALRARGITEAVIKSRGRDQAQLRRTLHIAEGSGPVLAFIDNRAAGRRGSGERAHSGLRSRVLHLGHLSQRDSDDVKGQVPGVLGEQRQE